MSLGATYALDGRFDSELARLQAQLVRTGFLNRASGRWDWDTYAAIGYADRYLQTVERSIQVHAATNTITINDAWVEALSKATPAPAGTVGRWDSIPHRFSWGTYATAGLVAVGLAGLGVWLWRRRR